MIYKEDFSFHTNVANVRRLIEYNSKVITRVNDRREHILQIRQCREINFYEKALRLQKSDKDIEEFFVLKKSEFLQRGNKIEEMR